MGLVRPAPLGFTALASAVLGAACGGDIGSGAACEVDGGPACETNIARERFTIRSPDGRVAIAAELGDHSALPGFGEGRTLAYDLTYEGATVIEASPLGLETDIAGFVTGLSVVDVSERAIEERYTTAAGKRRERTARGNELALRLASRSGDEIEVILRAHDDGAAFRYRLPGAGEVEVSAEATGFRFPGDASGIMAPYDLFGVHLFGTYEQVFKEVLLGESTPSTGWAFPALFHAPSAGAWMLVTESDLGGDYCGARLHQRPEGPLYRLRLPAAEEGLGVGAAKPRAARPLATPWRVIMVGEPGDLVGSTLVDDLAAPSALADTSWIRPGRAAWSWLSQGTGDPALQREYIDFAAEMGWEYVLIDAGWDQWEDADEEVQALAADAAAAGVKLLLWYNSGGEHTANPATPRDRLDDPDARREELARIADWGVAGIKIDFFESDKQDRIHQYLGIARDAAAEELLVNFHGATIPRGWQRTYPNIVTHEATRGAEYHKFPIDSPDADQHLAYVFTRNVVGSMDYTPATFELALEETDIPYAHTLALPVLFESGLQHFAGRADADPDAGYRAVFAEFPFVRELMAEMPVVWDETRLLGGNPRTHAALARRSGRAWWVAGIAGNGDSIDLSLPLSFLGEGRYAARIVRRGGGSADLDLEEREVTSSGTLSVSLAPRDGFVAVFEPR